MKMFAKVIMHRFFFFSVNKDLLTGFNEKISCALPEDMYSLLEF